MSEVLLLSIKPRYVEKILSGEKGVELRRRKPRSLPGDWLAIYESAPTMALVAITQITEVRVSSPQCLWRKVGPISGITKDEFDEYFAGTDRAIGIAIKSTLELATPIPLADLRSAWPRFHPPQGFIYLSDSQRQFVLDRAGSSNSQQKDAA